MKNTSLCLVLSAISMIPFDRAYAATEIVQEGRCIYLMRDGKKLGEMCSAGSTRVSAKESKRRMDSLGIGQIIKRSGRIKLQYEGYDSETLAKAIISVENASVDPDAVSSAGAVGIMQLMPQTASMTALELTDPERNITAGMEHFDYLYSKHSQRYGNDSLKFALAEYLVGARNLEKVISDCHVHNWSDLKSVAGTNWSKLSDSNGTLAIDYAEKIINNYYLFKK